MIRYALRCDDGHDFDGWFRDSAAFEAQRAAGLVACAVCGSAAVDKSVMAPAVAGDRPRGPSGGTSSGDRLAAFRRAVEANSEDVGRAFPEEVRRIARGDAEARAIRGDATPAETRELLADGAPILPLPWPRRRDA